MTPVPSVEPDVVTRSSMLAVVAGALTVALTVGSIVLGLTDDVPPAAPGLAGAVFGVTGGLVASRRPRLVIGWMLLVVGLALTLASFCLDWARHSLVVDPGSLPAGELALWLGTWVWVVGYCVLAALLPLRLPDGASPVGVWRVVWWAALAVSALAVAGWALTPYDQLDRPPLEGLDASVTSPTGTALGPVMLAASLPLLAVCSLAGLISLVQRLRRSVGEERQQAKWVVWGAMLSLALLAIGQVVGPEGGSDVLLAVAVLPLPLGIAVASLRYRLWDVDLVINRTLVYAVLTALVVAVYVVVVLALGDLLGERTGAPLVATVLVALGAEPAHRRVQRFVDRWPVATAPTPTGRWCDWGNGSRRRRSRSDPRRCAVLRMPCGTPSSCPGSSSRSKTVRHPPVGPRRPTASGCRSCTPEPSSGTSRSVPGASAARSPPVT